MTTTMTSPRTRGSETNAAKHTEHPTAQRWINECVALCQPDHVHVCTGGGRRKKAFDRRRRSQRRLYPAQSGKAARMLFTSEQSERCCANRTVHVHLHTRPGHGRTDE